MGQRRREVKKAVVLLSGGLDSATALAVASQQGFKCFALSVAYGQRHHHEIEAARRVANILGTEEHRVFEVDLSQFGGSALTDRAIEVPTSNDVSDSSSDEIPVTYVPARNTVFLSIALAWGETIGAQDFFIGVNAVDYSGYPDCRPEFIRAFESVANLATRVGVCGNSIKIHAPLISMTKSEIIRLGTDLGVDYSKTVSCYQPNDKGEACGRCDSCRLRAKGFADAGLPDPTAYISH